MRNEKSDNGMKTYVNKKHEIYIDDEIVSYIQNGIAEERCF